MSQHVVTLVWDRDEATGTEGFLCENYTQEMYSSIAGVLIAHDVMEHLNGVSEIGTVHDELQAIGAMWFVRGLLGDFYRNTSFTMPNSPIRVMVNEVVNTVGDLFEGLSLYSLPPTQETCVVDDEVL